MELHIALEVEHGGILKSGERGTKCQHHQNWRSSGLVKIEDREWRRREHKKCEDEPKQKSQCPD